MADIAPMEFTVGMLMRAMARRSNSDQIDRHIISLASGIPYNELGAMTRRDYNGYLDQLRLEVIPEPLRVVWNGETERWSARLCECECECDQCWLVIECGVCECGGKEVANFRDVLENDMERVKHSSPGRQMDYPRLVEIIIEADGIRDWRLKRYKTIETAIVWTMAAPLSGIQT